MDTIKIIQSQYLASLEMLKNAVVNCPAWLWADPEPRNKFWHIAYHAIFYTHLYLQPAEKDFKAWSKHRDPLGSLSEAAPDQAVSEEPYSQDEILAYLAFCQEEVKRGLPQLDLDSQESGFFWLPFSKLELQVYNIRHLQQHTGELYERLGSLAGIEVDWVGMVHS